MKVYLVLWEYGGNDVEGIFLTKDDAEKAVEMLNASRGSSPHYFFKQYEVEDFKTFEARINQDEDLINKQAAIEYFKRIIDATNTNGRYNLGFIDRLEFCINHLSTMSSVQPEQKKGIWMNTGIGIMCSNCYYKLETTGLLSRCPHCGARMGEWA